MDHRVPSSRDRSCPSRDRSCPGPDRSCRAMPTPVSFANLLTSPITCERHQNPSAAERANMSLKKYAEKRNFSISPEPAGAQRPGKFQGAPLLYVIQKHRASQLHYDFPPRSRRRPALLGHTERALLGSLCQAVGHASGGSPVEYGHFEGVSPKGSMPAARHGLGASANRVAGKPRATQHCKRGSEIQLRGKKFARVLGAGSHARVLRKPSRQVLAADQTSRSLRVAKGRRRGATPFGLKPPASRGYRPRGGGDVEKAALPAIPGKAINLSENTKPARRATEKEGGRLLTTVAKYLVEALVSAGSQAGSTASSAIP